MLMACSLPGWPRASGGEGGWGEGPATPLNPFPASLSQTAVPRAWPCPQDSQISQLGLALNHVQ